ncbi:unnamed protein product [Merluccius merluccius]
MFVAVALPEDTATQTGNLCMAHIIVSALILFTVSFCVWLECFTSPPPSSEGIKYTWTVGNETFMGAKLKYFLEEGEETANCTVSNPASEESHHQLMTCMSDCPQQHLLHHPAKCLQRALFMMEVPRAAAGQKVSPAAEHLNI